MGGDILTVFSPSPIPTPNPKPDPDPKPNPPDSDPGPAKTPEDGWIGVQQLWRFLWPCFSGMSLARRPREYGQTEPAKSKRNSPLGPSWGALGPYRSPLDGLLGRLGRSV